MAHATRTTRTETREVTDFTLTLSEDERNDLLDLLSEAGPVTLDSVYDALGEPSGVSSDDLRVGDRVRITQYREDDSGYRLAPLVAGKTGTLVITDDRDDGLPYKVELDTPLEDYGSLWVHAVERI